MNSTRHTVKRTVGILTTLTMLMGILVALGPAAFAQLPPPEPAPAHRDPIVIHHDSPLWVFVVVVLASIAFTMGAQLLLAKSRATLRHRLAHV